MQKETGASKLLRALRRAVSAVAGNRKLELAVYGGIVLLAVALYAGSLASKREAAPQPEVAQETGAAVYTEAEMEKKLAAVLSCIRGAGHVEVMVTFDTGRELVTAMSTNVLSNESETTDGEKTSATMQTTEVSEPATVSGGGGNEPIVLMEKQPVVRGVIVVAEGAADTRVRLSLQRAVEAVLNIAPTKIEVFELSYATAE